MVITCKFILLIYRRLCNKLANHVPRFFSNAHSSRKKSLLENLGRSKNK